jgi:hypothetical protein
MGREAVSGFIWFPNLNIAKRRLYSCMALIPAGTISAVAHDTFICRDIYPEGAAVAATAASQLPIHLFFLNELQSPQDNQLRVGQKASLTESDWEFKYLQRLITAHPKGLLVRNALGFLPLHIAALHNAPRLLFKTLLKACPRAIEERVSARDGNYDNFLPLQLLCLSPGDFSDILDLVVPAYPAALAECFPRLPPAHRELFGRTPGGYLPAHAVALRVGHSRSALACVIDYNPKAAAAVTEDQQTVIPPCSTAACDCIYLRARDNFVAHLSQTHKNTNPNHDG